MGVGTKLVYLGCIGILLRLQFKRQYPGKVSPVFAKGQFTTETQEG